MAKSQFPSEFKRRPSTSGPAITAHGVVTLGSVAQFTFKPTQIQTIQMTTSNLGLTLALTQLSIQSNTMRAEQRQKLKVSTTARLRVLNVSHGIVALATCSCCGGASFR
jgi:hypothetical protein